MRHTFVSAGLCCGLAAWAVLLLAVPAAAQPRQQPVLNPEDQLAPSQMAQPLPAPVQQPGGAPAAAAKGAPKSKPAVKRAARAAKPTRGAAAVKPPRSGGVRTVVECSGPFAKDSGMLALAMAFDSRNMIFTHETVQGAQVGATVLFPKDPRRRLEVWWSNPNRTGTYLIDIAGKSIWTAPEGLRLGLTLEQLEKLNRKPFKLKGFDKENVASVASWDDGALGKLAGGCKAGVSMHVTTKTAATELPDKDEYSSDDAALRALKPTVSEILIGY